MNKTLTAIIAAAGILGCARDVPVYSPQPEVVQEVPGIGGVYKSVWSDAEQLKLSWYTQAVDGTRGVDFSWSRFEPRDSAECLKENFAAKMRVDFPDEGIAGYADFFMEDTGCEGNVDSCRGTYTPDNGNQVDISADVCGAPSDDFVELGEFIDTDIYNRAEQVNAWHIRKGL